MTGLLLSTLQPVIAWFVAAFAPAPGTAITPGTASPVTAKLAATVRSLRMASPSTSTPRRLFKCSAGIAIKLDFTYTSHCLKATGQPQNSLTLKRKYTNCPMIYRQEFMTSYPEKSGQHGK
jgi:hypothetical protein